MTSGIRWGTTQTITYDGSVGMTSALGGQTYYVRLVATTNACVRIGNGAQTATAADVYLPANIPEIVTVTPGSQIAALKFTGGTAGILYVTEGS